MEPTEARRSQRARGVSAPGFVDDAYDDDYSGDDDGEEGAPRRAWRAGGRRAYIPQANQAPEHCAAHGPGALPDPHARAQGPNAWDGQREFVLPPLLNEHGVEIQRNKSCHICTQCLASWCAARDPPGRRRKRRTHALPHSQARQLHAPAGLQRLPAQCVPPAMHM